MIGNALMNSARFDFKIPNFRFCFPLPPEEHGKRQILILSGRQKNRNIDLLPLIGKFHSFEIFPREKFRVTHSFQISAAAHFAGKSVIRAGNRVRNTESDPASAFAVTFRADFDDVPFFHIGILK